MLKRYEQSFKETLVELYDSGQDYSKADFIALKKELTIFAEKKK